MRILRIADERHPIFHLSVATLCGAVDIFTMQMSPYLSNLHRIVVSGVATSTSHIQRQQVVCQKDGLARKLHLHHHQSILVDDHIGLSRNNEEALIKHSNSSATLRMTSSLRRRL